MPRFARPLLGLLCLWGCGLLGCGGEAEAESPRERPPARVEVQSGRTGVLEVEHVYLGSVRSVAQAQLAAELAGRVQAVEVRVGDRVTEGQLLVRIDGDLAAADVSAARANAARSQAEADQAANDAERFDEAGARTVAEVEIERARSQAGALSAARDRARAELSRARQTLQRARVVAPFDGVVSARRVDPGAWVAAGTPLLDLVVEDRTEVFVRVEPRALADVEVGQSATLSNGEHEASASVAGVVRALDPATRTGQLRLRPTGDATWLLPGEAVDVRITLSRDGEGLVVPRDALVPGVAETRLFRVRDGAAEPITVTVLARGVDEVRVVAEGQGDDDALSPSDQIVVRGNERLRPGQSVQITPASGEETTPR
ncbi:MAG: efflux RND transporter periplasmic adaptor subunit [Sandaracinaceae bacterium]